MILLIMGTPFLFIVAVLLDRHSITWHAPLAVTVIALLLPAFAVVTCVWMWCSALRHPQQRGTAAQFAANMWWYLTNDEEEMPPTTTPWKTYSNIIFAYFTVVIVGTLLALSLLTSETVQATHVRAPARSAPKPARPNNAQLLDAAEELAPIQERYRRRYGRYAASLSALREFDRTVVFTPGLTVTSFTGPSAQDSSWVLSQNGQQLVHFGRMTLGVFLRQTTTPPTRP